MKRIYFWMTLLAGGLVLALVLSVTPGVRGFVRQVVANGVYLPIITGGTGVALPPADEATSRITVPSGFAIRIYAADLAGPRLMTLGPDGQLYVAERNGGNIVRLPDANRDGVADARQVVASGLNGPHSVEWYGGSLYVAENDKVTKLTDTNRDGDFLDPGEKITVVPNLPTGGSHTTRTARFGPDGKLYVSAGSTCNVCVETDKRRATIMRFNPDGTIPADNPFATDPDPNRKPVWAEGLRNSVDFLWTPGGQLWADHNGSDNILDSSGQPDTRPPEEIVINVEKGKFYGWPYCYTPTLGLTPPGTQDVRDTSNWPNNTFDCARSTPSLFTDVAHSAPLGMTLGGGTNFPVDYRDDLFVAYHGSWNTNNAATYRDCKVERIVIQNGQPVDRQTFANIVRPSGQKCSDAWGRPAGVTFGADGALYISDDQGGRVYRVVYTGR